MEVPNFENVQAGDLVWLRDSYDNTITGVRQVRVEKTTKLHLIIDGVKYQRRTGNAAGTDYMTRRRWVVSAAWAQDYIEDRKQREREKEREAYRNELRFRLRDVPDDKLERVEALINELAGTPK